MQMSDECQIAAPRPVVWAALFDPDVLKACVPGCQELSGSAAEGYEATVVQKVGPVKATFKGTVSMSDVVEGESCTLSG
ncbi:MAG: carbon monoxide dehydrogenase, partial [Roseinatronobacter sp.]|nr:carbon monoxide dehydrogenase [Roseinatronobacter sp.]